MTREGLEERGILPSRMGYTLDEMESMLVFLQDVAQRELRGESLSTEEYERIKFYGGWLERMTLAAADAAEEGGRNMFSEDEQAALVADVATGPVGIVLEEAIGRIYEIFVVVPDGYGGLQVAKGGVFSYYEFSWPMEDRLTNEAWREMLLNAEQPPQPAWTSAFIAE